MNNKTAQYQYSHVDMETVVQNPNEYIIPPCQPACKALWDKNIETFMVSNYEDDNLYILLGKLDENNQRIMDENVCLDPRFFFSEYHKSFGIKVAGQDITAGRELLELTELFEMQDTFRYKSPEEFLTDFKRKGSNSYEILPDGAILIKENPDNANVTFEEALAKTGKQDLYISSENRVYDSPMYLKWHQRYQENKVAFNFVTRKDEYNQEHMILMPTIEDVLDENFNYEDYVDLVLSSEYIFSLLEELIYDKKPEKPINPEVERTMEEYAKRMISLQRKYEAEIKKGHLTLDYTAEMKKLASEYYKKIQEINSLKLQKEKEEQIARTMLISCLSQVADGKKKIESGALDRLKACSEGELDPGKLYLYDLTKVKDHEFYRQNSKYFERYRQYILANLISKDGMYSKTLDQLNVKK